MPVIVVSLTRALNKDQQELAEALVMTAYLVCWLQKADTGNNGGRKKSSEELLEFSVEKCVQQKPQSIKLSTK